MKKALFAILLVLAILGVALFWIGKPGGGSSSGSDKAPLVIYCGAGLKKPVEAIAAAYDEETGSRSQFQFGGSATLLSQLQVAKSGDLFVAADDGTMKDAKRLGLVAETLPLLRQEPVIAVAKGNPKGITSLQDLMRPDVRVAVSNPEAASIGKATKAAFGDQWDAFSRKVSVMKPTVTEVAADLSLGSVDAAVVWKAMADQFPDLEAIHVPELEAETEVAQIGVLRSAENPTAALKFARFATAPETGGPVVAATGFDPVAGDTWEDRPELILYSGGVNRPAIEELVRSFSEREGIDVTTVFNGCGILCAAMQAMTGSSDPKFPDAYYACDICFVPPVAEHFPQVTLLTETDIGIAVPKGNPNQIKTLVDLANPGLRVGLCNAKQSTLGYMTDGMLRDSGLQKAIGKNVAVQVPTADFLINQMRGGALDAAIVYRVNAKLQEEHIDFIEINHPGALAVQPFSVRKDSPRALLAGRLLDHLLANEAAFTETGFIWRGGEETMPSKDIVVPDWLKPSTGSAAVE